MGRGIFVGGSRVLLLIKTDFSSPGDYSKHSNRSAKEPAGIDSTTTRSLNF
jgi:hypothetical protein